METAQLVSVLLVDDEPRFRQGLHTLLDFYTNNTPFQFKIVGEAATVAQTLSLTAQQHPNLIILDLELPYQDGITALPLLQEQNYQGKVLILSAHREDEWIFRAMQAGASGYLLKDLVASQLCLAITTVINDQIYLSPEVATSFFRMFHFYTGSSQKSSHSLHLTEREQEVLSWLVQGSSNEDIAHRLHITVATVKAHLTAIFEKLSVRSRTQAIIKALKMGLVSA